MTSLTNQFNEDEMRAIGNFTTPTLIVALVTSDPIVALRGMAELILNKDARLKACLENDELTKHWEKFEADFDCDSRDMIYADQLWALKRNLGVK